MINNTYEKIYKTSSKVYDKINSDYYDVLYYCIANSVYKSVWNTVSDFVSRYVFDIDEFEYVYVEEINDWVWFEIGCDFNE